MVVELTALQMEDVLYVSSIAFAVKLCYLFTYLIGQ